MTSASVDRVLAVLVTALAATGLVSLWQGAESSTWLFVLHAWLAGALVVGVALKLRASVPRAVRARRWVALMLSFVLTVVVVGSLVAGYVWAASGDVLWVDVAGLIRWTVLTIHAWLGLVALPIVVLHLVPRRWRMLRPRARSVRSVRAHLVSRRALLAGASLGVAGVGFAGLATLVERLGGGTDRRFTGSRMLSGVAFPPSTTFLGEPVPPVDLVSWRLTVGEVSFALDELRALGQDESSAILDCTSGWAFQGTWQGINLSTVLDAAGLAASDGQVEVRSVTGWATSLPMRDARGCLLAWSVNGHPLPLENGAPLRLVAPDRRGVEWVKWIASVRLS